MCETWLTADNWDRFNIYGYNFVGKHRAKSRGGGVALYVKNELQYKIRGDPGELKEQEYESLFIEIIQKKHCNVIVGEVYRTPGSGLRKFLTLHKEVLKQTSQEGKFVIIGADQNIDLMQAKEHLLTSKFIDLNFTYGMAPTVTRPTRVTYGSATLIDNLIFM